MTTTARIDYDIKCLRTYFQKLFELLREAIEENKTAPIIAVDTDSLETQETFFHINHLIKPSMVIDIYSLVDFWLKEICNQQKKRKNLNLSYRDIKGNSDLDVFQKYLTKVVGKNLDKVQNSYKQLDKLRIVRNKCIHNGGHVLDENEKAKISTFNGISFAASVILIEDTFIFDSIDNAKTYLFETAKF